MLIAGGVYVETCVTPPITALMGSAGRAAVALAALEPNVELHTFHPRDQEGDLVANFGGLGISVVAYPSRFRFEFRYLFPLSEPRITPLPTTGGPQISVSADRVIRFGCLEGDFRVDGETVVYDPQSGDASRGFTANGSRAGSLAVVANWNEALAMARAVSISEAAATIRRQDHATVVIIKDGTGGAHIFNENSLPQTVPPYDAHTIYKIGSGDVFTASFAQQWMLGKHPVAAADVASRATAEYVETRRLPPFNDLAERRARFPLPRVDICLVGDSATTAGIWLIDEARRALLALGANVQSLYHDRVPRALNDTSQYPIDQSNVVVTLQPTLETISERDFVLRCIDSGKQVIAMTECPEVEADLREMGCVVSGDLTATLYSAFWQQQ